MYNFSKQYIIMPDIKYKKNITKKITVYGAIVDFLLAVFKVLIGYLYNSQALIADGLHSFSDLLSDALVLFANKHSADAPDTEHPYGHQRFETLATLALSALLLIVGIAVIIDGITEFIYEPQPIITGALLFVIIIISIIAKEGLYWLTMFYAKKVKSSMLEANAWHHRTDSISSFVVLIGIIGASFGYHYFDNIAAMIVGMMISYIAWKLSIPCIKELLDSAIEPDIIAELQENIMTIDSVVNVHSFRTRRSGNNIIIDIHIQVNSFLSVSEGHMVTISVEKIINKKLGNIADTVVHIDPENDENENLYTNLPSRSDIIKLIRNYLDSNNYLDCLDKIQLHYIKGQVFTDIYLTLTCLEATDKEQLYIKISAISDISPIFADTRLYFSVSNS